MSKLNQGDPAYIKAMTHFLEGEWIEAEKAFLTLQAAYPGSEYIPMTLGNIYYSLGRLDEAVVMYEKANSLKPHYGIALYKLGVCLFRMGKLVKAQEAFQKVMEVPNQSHAMASYFLALSSYLMGQDKRAEDAFEQFRNISPESLIANFFLAQLRIKEQNYPEGLRLLDDLLVQSPRMAEAHYMRGQCLYGLHRNSDAVAAFRTALSISPDDQRIKTKLTLLTEVEW